jgi:hypothetical protein
MTVTGRDSTNNHSHYFIPLHKKKLPKTESVKTRFLEDEKGNFGFKLLA